MKHSRMKRIIPIFLSAVLTLGLSACDSAPFIQETEAPDALKEESTEASIDPETAAETVETESTDDSAAESSDTESASR